MTPEQVEQVRRWEEFDEQKRLAWEAMTPEEWALEEAGWEQVIRSINEPRRGYRPVFVDP